MRAAESWMLGEQQAQRDACNDRTCCLTNDEWNYEPQRDSPSCKKPKRDRRI